jgi:hypothetical protein
VLLLWLAGGASQLETFDPKPGRSTGGPFKAIPTVVPGTEPGTDGVPPAPGQEPAKTKDAKTKDGETADPKVDKQTEEQRLWFSLLQAYPPAAGWGKAKRDEISHRLAVVGAQPSEAELKFVEQFAEWEKACAHFGVDAAPKPADDAAPPTDTKGSAKAKKKTADEPAPEPESKSKARADSKSKKKK